MPPTIYFVRHAQGTHNIKRSNHHLRDPNLTPLGEDQCQELSAKFPHHDKLDLILASPLRRTLHTALLAFAPALQQGKKVVAWPDVQEASSVSCDTGSQLRKLSKEFKDLPMDFGMVEEGWEVKGKYAPTVGALTERAKGARRWLRERPEDEVVVVSHGCFLHFLTNDWGDTNLSHVSGWANAEFRSFVFQGEDDDVSLIETEESRQRRGSAEPLAKQDQSLYREATVQRWVKWGVISQ